LKEFQNSYLDVLSKTNFRSASFFNTSKAASSSDAVTATATGSSTTGTITIDSITQLATNETVKSGSTVSKPLTGTVAVSDIVNNIQAGDSFSLNLDGKVKTITFDGTFVSDVKANAATFETKLQSLIDTALGQAVTSRVVTVDAAGAGNLGVLTLGVASGSKLTINTIGDTSNTLADLGFTNGQSNKVNTSASLSELSLATTLTTPGSFTINNATFTYTSTDTLASIMAKVNASSDAGVTMAYSSVTDKFTITAKNSGSGENAAIADVSGNFMTALGLTSGADVDPGVNAILSVDGLSITRSSNTFDVDGVKVTLENTSASAVTLTVSQDSSSLSDSIKKFVEDYNTMVDLVNGYIGEEVDSDYQPLTDEQKADMSESEIATWEKKAKSGILRGDGILRSISSKLQSAVTGLSVNGFSLYSMGITSAGYTENGKLKIDESKLKTALETKGDEIRELFSSENGLANAISKVITGATKTSGVKGSRCTLVEVAGVDNTTSDTENSIYDQIKRTNKNIKTLKTRLTDEETRLWNKFTAMESAINSLNSQSAMLSSFTSS
jgi:flagellar hook-associated protein 2